MRKQGGFTLVELMVTFFIFSLVSVGFYQVMFSGSRGADTTRSVVRISEEARGGFNRLVRDTREAGSINCPPVGSVCPTDTAYSIIVDFDGDGVAENPNQNGDYENLTFEWDGLRVLVNGEVLIDGVDCVGGADGSCDEPLFSYSSNHLEYDWNGDGTTTGAEIDAAGPSRGLAIGNQNGVLDRPSELALISSVSFAFTLEQDGRVTEFSSEAQMRNRR